MTYLATWRRRQRRKFPIPPLMVIAFAALVGLVVFAALNRGGGLGDSMRSAVGGTVAGGGGEKSIILAYLRENAGEPDSVELIKFKRFSEDPRETCRAPSCVARAQTPLALA